MDPVPSAPTSCAQSRGFGRIDRPNSRPRRIAAFAMDARAAHAVARAAEAAGDAAVMQLGAGSLSEEADMPSGPDRPDLLVVAGSSGATAEHLAALRDLALRWGVLVTAIVLSDADRPQTGKAVDAMRRHADLFVQTTDDDFLALMLHWLARAD